MRHSSSSQKLTPTEEHEDVLYRLVGVVSHVGSTHSTGESALLSQTDEILD